MPTKPKQPMKQEHPYITIDRLRVENAELKLRIADNWILIMKLRERIEELEEKKET